MKSFTLALSATAIAIVCGCNQSSNMGDLISSEIREKTRSAKVILSANPPNLTYDESYVKMSMGNQDATLVRRMFQSYGHSPKFRHPIDRSYIPTISDKRWDIHKAKISWSGVFNRTYQGENYQCTYVFDSSTKDSVLYIYVVSALN